MILLLVVVVVVVVVVLVLSLIIVIKVPFLGLLVGDEALLAHQVPASGERHVISISCYMFVCCLLDVTCLPREIVRSERGRRGSSRFNQSMFIDHCLVYVCAKSKNTTCKILSPIETEFARSHLATRLLITEGGD